MQSVVFFHLGNRNQQRRKNKVLHKNITKKQGSPEQLNSLSIRFPAVLRAAQAGKYLQPGWSDEGMKMYQLKTAKPSRLLQSPGRIKATSFFLVFSCSFSRESKSLTESCRPLLPFTVTNTRWRCFLSVSQSCCPAAQWTLLRHNTHKHEGTRFQEQQ